MTRRNFPSDVRKAAVRRAMRPNAQGHMAVHCEQCGLPAKTFEIDHVIPDRLNGKPVLENARVLCRTCHVEKTAADRKDISKNNGLEERSLGIRRLPKGRQFAKGPKQPGASSSPKLANMPRRQMYKEIAE